MGYDLRATATGHKRPDIVAANPVCFIHTEAAIFAIDEDGVCCYVTSVTGAVPRNANRCRGAEYVACLDLASEDGLVADPRIGGTGLFVGRGASQKMALLRTGPITRVQFVEDDDVVEDADASGAYATSGEHAVVAAEPVAAEPGSAEVSQVKPVDVMQRLLDDKLEELEAIELEPFEVIEETPTPVVSSAPPPPPPPSKGPYATMRTENVTPFTLPAPTPPRRRSSAPPPTAPMMDSAELLQAALAMQLPTMTPPRAPATPEIELGWQGVDPRRTRVGMPIVKLS